MSKHTSGQLRIDKFSGMGQPQLEISSDEHIFWIAGVGAPCEDPEVAMANAILFHAAPGLLKVCRTILTIFHLEGLTITSQFPLSENSQRLKAVMDDMRAHVAKATGEALDADATD